MSKNFSVFLISFLFIFFLYCGKGEKEKSPVCGNGYCEYGENSQNCPQDCKGEEKKCKVLENYQMNYSKTFSTCSNEMDEIVETIINEKKICYFEILGNSISMECSGEDEPTIGDFDANLCSGKFSAKFQEYIEDCDANLTVNFNYIINFFSDSLNGDISIKVSMPETEYCYGINCEIKFKVTGT